MQVYMVVMATYKNNCRRHDTNHSNPCLKKKQTELTNIDLNSHSTCLCIELCKFW